MNEQLFALWSKARKHLNRIMIGLFIVMAGLVIWIYVGEVTSGIDTEPPAPRIWEPPKIIEGETLMEDFLTTFTSEIIPLNESREVIVLVQNPWEIRAAKDQEKIEQEALRLHQEAKAAFARGDFRRALILATQARANKPSFQENDELLSQIAAKLAEGGS